MHISASRDISQVDKKNHIGMIFIFFCNDRKIHGSFYVDIMLEKGSMDLPVLTETQLEHKKMKLSWFVPSGKWIPEPDQGDRPISGYLHTYGFLLVYCNPSKAHFSGAPGPESPAPTVSKDTNFFW